MGLSVVIANFDYINSTYNYKCDKTECYIARLFLKESNTKSLVYFLTLWAGGILSRPHNSKQKGTH